MKDLIWLNSLGIRSSIVPLTDMGFRLFPLYEGQKLPSIKGWRELASDDPKVVLEWFNEPRNKNGNLGLATGEYSRVIVLDADNEESLAWCVDLFRHPPHVLTSRGGHFYVKYPVGLDVRNSASALFKGVDVRGNGGLVVLPPSVSYKNGEARKYLWNEAATVFPLEASEVLRGWLLPQQAPKREALRNAKPALPSLPNELPRSVKNMLDKMLGEVARAEEGQRNQTLNQACFMVGAVSRLPFAASNELSVWLARFVGASSVPEAEAEKTAKAAYERGTRLGNLVWTTEDEFREQQWRQRSLLASFAEGI